MATAPISSSSSFKAAAGESMSVAAAADAAVGSSSSSMSAQDLALCKQTIQTLLSPKYKDKSDLFRAPFDVTQLPDYETICPRPLDLSTVLQHLESGNMYSSRQAFFDDVMLIFENAIRYHTGRPQTQWIVKKAKEMIKVVEREKRNVDKKAAKGGGSGGGPGGGGTKKTAAAATSQQQQITAAAALVKKETSASNNTEGTKKLPSLKLKLNTTNKEDRGGGAVSTNITSTTPFPDKNASSSFSSSSAAATPAVKPTKSSSSQSNQQQPKLKLKLSLSSSSSHKQQQPSTGKAETPRTGPATTTTANAPNSAPPKIETATSASTTTTTTTKIQVKPQGSRGKELPKGVTAPQQKSKSKNTSNKRKSSLTPTTTTITTSTATLSSGAMTPARKEQCVKVLAGLKRRKYKDVNWFLQPVALKQMDDYRAKIKHPMDLGTMSSKLDKNQYKAIDEFVRDMRRIFANCLRFNTSVRDSLRPVAVEVLSTAEEVMAWFLAKPEVPSVVYPPLLYCWKTCVAILDTLCNLTNPTDGHATAFYFLHPVSIYWGGNFPADYLEKVPRPMDFGTITSTLLEGQYTTVDAFAADCRLVIANCMAYYGDKTADGGREYMDQANRLNEHLSQQLDALLRYDQSTTGAADRAAALSPLNVQLEKPSQQLLLSLLQDLRSIQYTDKATQITEPALQTFEYPEPLTLYPDYLQVISNPMDLQTVERKIKSGLYETPEDFEYDMFLMFRNCDIYHGAKKNEHRVALGKYITKQFRKLFTTRMRSFDDPSMSSLVQSSPSAAEARKELKRMASPSSSNSHGNQPTKKMKMEAANNNSNSGGVVSKGKSAPRISIAAAPAPTTTAAAVPSTTTSTSGLTRVKSPKTPTSMSNTTKKKSLPTSSTSTTSTNESSLPKSNQPVPLHVAIARVKEGFPLRRHLKDLQDWEKACARFLKELLRHSWISAHKPKYIFAVPVGDLFPDLREEYMAKIKKPMDLTTVECTLMHGSRYLCAEDFVSDVALVFVNAITFNKDGRDIGDPLSCAYYDASIHLLRFTRWLSLELLSEYLEESDHVDLPRSDGLPPFTWKLTSGNRIKAREETESIVLNEPIEKSIEGDRYTWMEAECEKLLKALRHQSDLRYMTFFIQPNYPPDYAAFISKPMDWERCQRTLKKRQYDKFGDVIADLRLIFSNALKYNLRLKGTDTISGKAYDAANYMSNKLEAAIDKMMISVSDRIERERIDHANAEREIEAAERAEQEQIRAAWKSQNETDGSNTAAEQQPSTGSERATTSLVVNRRVVKRKASTFEMSYFDDEEEGTEQSHIDSLKQQKSMFEKQRQELVKLTQVARMTGGSALARLLGKDNAIKWVNDRTSKYKPPTKKEDVAAAAAPSANEPIANTIGDNKERVHIKMKLPSWNSMKSKKKRVALNFE